MSDQTKAVLDDYREAARKLYAQPGLTIPLHGSVHVMADGGAFVEAVVWVPPKKKEEAEHGG